jgi:hypothetical protein
VCKDALNRDSTIQSDVRRFCTAYKPEEFGSLSTVRTMCHPVQTFIYPLFHLSRRRGFPSGPFTVSRGFCSSLHPFGHLSSPFGRLSVIDQLQILSKINLREDCFNCPDDVDSRPDVLIHKARIVIQISSTGRHSALVQTRVQQLRKLPIRLQPSEQLPIMV